MLTVLLILLLASFVTLIAAAMNKCPLWIPVALLVLIELVDHLPVK